jgi:hypothetical protein
VYVKFKFKAKAKIIAMAKYKLPYPLQNTINHVHGKILSSMIYINVPSTSIDREAKYNNIEILPVNMSFCVIQFCTTYKDIT